MLEGLDNVEWASLWACGPATEVPQLLRTLAFSDDREERKEALKVLTEERLIYQGMSILEVTPYAVPFLIELLTEESVKEKADILALLGFLAKGSTFLEGSGALDGYDEASAPPGCWRTSKTSSHPPAPATAAPSVL